MNPLLYQINTRCWLREQLGREMNDNYFALTWSVAALEINGDDITIGGTLNSATGETNALVINGSAHWMFASPDLGNYPFTQPPGWGSGLVTVYIMWAVVVMTMYGACRWFAALKQRRRDWWLSYL